MRMISWNQSDYFVVEFVDQNCETEVPLWKVELKFHNLNIDPSYFDQCLKMVFEGDRGVIVSEYNITFECADRIQKRQEYCEEKAKELMERLKTHPLWGKHGGPDLSDDYNNLD
jgi:hypothetical protein